MAEDQDLFERAAAREGAVQAHASATGVLWRHRAARLAGVTATWGGLVVVHRALAGGRSRGLALHAAAFGVWCSLVAGGLASAGARRGLRRTGA